MTSVQNRITPTLENAHVEVASSEQECVRLSGCAVEQIKGQVQQLPDK